jgi:signal transduction histidine kinase
MVPVWKSLHRTYHTFVLQAREKEVLFQWQGDMFDADGVFVGEMGRLHCLADATRIAQVLRNLISNSLKVSALYNYVHLCLPLSPSVPLTL